MISDTYHSKFQVTIHTKAQAIPARHLSSWLATTLKPPVDSLNPGNCNRTITTANARIHRPKNASCEVSIPAQARLASPEQTRCHSDNFRSDGAILFTICSLKCRCQVGCRLPTVARVLARCDIKGDGSAGTCRQAGRVDCKGVGDGGHAARQRPMNGGRGVVGRDAYLVRVSARRFEKART